MVQSELKMLNRIYQDASVGMQAIDKVLKKVKDEELKKLFKKQYDEYQKFADRADVMALNKDKEVKDNSMFKKLKQTAMIYMSLWADASPRHIVEMMISGTVMGIIDTIKTEKDCAPKTPELKDLVTDFKAFQDDFYEKLKKLLAKV